ncbi:MAG: dihydrofolate reductase family protein [Propionicimonas sp.]|uniref:dihydrofolate reductase family protein n=1 Tax=Propionicimonas sp. TaxID=1955623 RepID=UPI003D1296EE
MRELRLVEFLSVDGVMQGLANPDGDFAHPGWGMDYPVQPPSEPGAANATTAYLFGRRTYEELAAFWPTQPDDNPMAAHLNATPKYLVSRTVPTPTWQPTTVIADDVAGSVAWLKSEGEGVITLLGSGQLARFLMAHDLVDRLTLVVHPLLLGTGTGLFGGLPSPRRLLLASVAHSDLGTLILDYRFRHD